MSVLTQKEREFVDSIRINLVCYSIAKGQRLVSFIDRLDARCEEMEDKLSALIETVESFTISRLEWIREENIKSFSISAIEIKTLNTAMQKAKEVER